VGEEIVARAEDRLGGEQREFRRLLTEVERARDELAEERGRLEDEREEMVLARDRLSRERRAVEAEGREERDRVRRELESFRVEVRRQLREEKERIRRQLEAGRKKGLATAATKRLFESAPDPGSDSRERKGLSPGLETGARVRNQSWGWEGEFLSQTRDRATVLVAGKRIECPADELVALNTDKAKGRKPPPVVSVCSHRQAEQELSLVGRRVDPALEALDDFLDRALLGSLLEVRVIHGHGSGRLRKAVRAFLAKHPAVARARPGGDGEGGDGATVVKLQER
jgi:DNA mismatch repair protein MutS2